MIIRSRIWFLFLNCKVHAPSLVIVCLEIMVTIGKIGYDIHLVIDKHAQVSAARAAISARMRVK